MTGYASLLLRSMPSDSPHRPQIEAILGAGERISQIVHEMAAVRKYVTKPYVEGAEIVDFEAAVDEDAEACQAPR